MKLNSLKLYVLALLASSIFVASCDKNEGTLNGAGKTIVKLPQADDELVAIALDFVTTPLDLLVVDVRRDVPNEGELSKTHVVKIKNDQALVDAYNAQHGTVFEALPANAFQADASNPFNGNEWTVTFGPGDHAKPIKIKLDMTKMNLSRQYALGFTIQDAGGATVGSQKAVIVNVGVKNKYDGVYVMTGTLQDLAVPALVAKSPTEVHLVTTGPNSVYLHNSGTSIASFKDLFPIMNAGAESAYGAFTPEFIFDQGTNDVTDVVNAYGQPAPNTRSAAIDPTGVNHWDEATKTLTVKWLMYQPSVITGVRTYFDFVFTYKGPR